MAIRLAIIGCGNVSQYAHIPAALALEGIDLVAVVDATPERLKAGGELAQLDESERFADWRDVVSRPDIDALVVTTPQFIRPEIAIAGANAGKHLLCEKPLAVSPADAEAMVAAANANDVVLATVHNYTLVPVYQEIKEIILSGEIGELETATLNFLSVEDRPGTSDYRPTWRHDVKEAGGGVLMDMLHAVYLGWWLFDDTPTAVSAFVDRRLDGAATVEDYALVRYEMPKGQVMINMAWGLGPGGTELMGSNGRIVLRTQRNGTHPFVAPDTIHVYGKSGERQYEPGTDWGRGHITTMESFRDAILTGSKPAATGAEGAFVLQAVVAAYKSAALGSTVALPLSTDDPVFLKGAIGIADLDLPANSRIRRRGLYGVSQPAGG